MMGSIHFRVILVFAVICKISFGDGVRVFLYPVPIPRSEDSGFEDKSIQFQVQEVAEGTYHFGYDVDLENAKSFREEKRLSSGLVIGRFGYVDPEGILRVTEYEADAQGFRSRSLAADPAYFRPVDRSHLQLVGPIPKPTSNSYTLTSAGFV